jgi:nitrogen fixation/metabolism regulation signal transduction histidine kinase
MAEQLAIPESIASNLIPVVEKINFLLIVGIPPIIVLLFIWGGILTHRFIGPLNRLEKDLKKIADGDYSVRLRIRKDDDLHSLTDAINKVIDKLEKQ